MGEIIAFRGRSRPARPALSESGDSFLSSPVLDPQPPEQYPAESTSGDWERDTGRQWFLSGAVAAFLLLGG
jgi:hypothetical protein